MLKMTSNMVAKSISIFFMSGQFAIIVPVARDIIPDPNKIPLKSDIKEKGN